PTEVERHRGDRGCAPLLGVRPPRTLLVTELMQVDGNPVVAAVPEAGVQGEAVVGDDLDRHRIRGLAALPCPVRGTRERRHRREYSKQCDGYGGTGSAPHPRY